MSPFACCRLGLLCLAAMAASLSCTLSGNPPSRQAGPTPARAGRAGISPLREKVVRLGSTLWRTGDCNWLAYAADGKSIYACCKTTSMSIRYGRSATDVIRQLDVHTGRQLRQVVLPALAGQPDVPSALDKRIASVSLAGHLVAFYATWPQQGTIYVWDMARRKVLLVPFPTPATR